MRRLAVAALLVLLNAGSSNARTWHIRSDGSGDVSTIQAAADLAVAGDTIMLASGLYRQHAWCENLSNVIFVSQENAETTIITSDWQGPALAFAFCNGVIVDRLSFRDSSAGAVYFYRGSNGAVTNTIFLDNGHTMQFPALQFEMSSFASVSGNIIVNNCGGISLTEFSNDVAIVGNTILGNSGTGVSMPAAINIEIANNIICGGSKGIAGVMNGGSLTCNNVFGNGTNYDLYMIPDPTGTDGNISQDPQFCAEDPVSSSNYFLQSDSPCAPGNHPQGFICGLIGQAPVGCSTVSARKESWSGIKAMFK